MPEVNKNNFLIWDGVFNEIPGIVTANNDTAQLPVTNQYIDIKPLLNDFATFGFNVDSLEVTLEDNPLRPTQWNAVSGTLRYFPPSNIQPGDQRILKYRVADTQGNKSNEATITITVMPRATAWRGNPPSHSCVVTSSTVLSGVYVAVFQVFGIWIILVQKQTGQTISPSDFPTGTKFTLSGMQYNNRQFTVNSASQSLDQNSNPLLNSVGIYPVETPVQVESSTSSSTGTLTFGYNNTSLGSSFYHIKFDFGGTPAPGTIIKLQGKLRSNGQIVSISEYTSQSGNGTQQIVNGLIANLQHGTNVAVDGSGSTWVELALRRSYWQPINPDPGAPNTSGSFGQTSVVYPAPVQNPADFNKTVRIGGVRTGLGVYAQLERYYIDNGDLVSPTQLKPNNVGDPDYIAPSQNLVLCPITDDQMPFFLFCAIPGIRVNEIRLIGGQTFIFPMLGFSASSPQPSQFNVDKTLAGQVFAVEVYITITQVSFADTANMAYAYLSALGYGGTDGDGGYGNTAHRPDNVLPILGNQKLTFSGLELGDNVAATLRINK